MLKEANNLRALFHAHKITNRSAFARQWNVPGGAKMIYQHINAIKPISFQAAVVYSKAFGMPLSSISQNAARQYEQLAKSCASINLEAGKEDVHADLGGSKACTGIEALRQEILRLPLKHQVVVLETMTAMVNSMKRQPMR